MPLLDLYSEYLYLFPYNHKDKERKKKNKGATKLFGRKVAKSDWTLLVKILLLIKFRAFKTLWPHMSF